MWIFGECYENSLALELKEFGFDVRQQHKINVYYREAIVGRYVADLLVENSVLIELKAVRALDNNHHTQCMNYLVATRLPICLLMNFGRPRIEIRRVVKGF